MTWTVDESRVRPFLSAAERRDVTGMLTGAPQRGRTFSDPAEAEAEAEADADAAPHEARKRWKDGKEHKDLKDGKDTKETKDYKDYKDTKDAKDTKDYKDTKDTKDGKDGKDGKETKDYKDYKDSKDTKDTKDGKEGKETKDFKDGKDSKDGKDGFDGAMAPSGTAAFVRPPAGSPRADPGSDRARGPGPGGRPDASGMSQAPPAPAEPLTEEQETAAELRSSRINRLLRRRGVVI
ncbi:hypothetical protein ACFW6V_14920 [Streptomyces sp. NPDC058734]|uniref:hypothetical protein n=1 Tax=Streptomyces sp. NPDC058734 TaxID=3346615 RepID=UPI003691EE6E